MNGIDVSEHASISVDLLLKSLGALAVLLALVLMFLRKYRNDPPPRP